MCVCVCVCVCVCLSLVTLKKTLLYFSDALDLREYSCPVEVRILGWDVGGLYITRPRVLETEFFIY